MWTPQQVSEWLQKTPRLAEYAEKFESLHIGGEEILVFGKNPAFVLEPLDTVPATASSSAPPSDEIPTSSPSPVADTPTSAGPPQSAQRNGEAPSSVSGKTSSHKLEPVSLSTLIPNQRHRKLFLRKVAALQKEVSASVI